MAITFAEITPAGHHPMVHQKLDHLTLISAFTAFKSSCGTRLPGKVEPSKLGLGEFCLLHQFGRTDRTHDVEIFGYDQTGLQFYLDGFLNAPVGCHASLEDDGRKNLFATTDVVEIIFDQGVGDLFIIRIAGNIVDDAALGSVEYAVEHLGVPLVVVLGHQQCGAVKATIQGGEAPGHIGSIVKAIEPAVTAAKEQPGDLLDNSVKTNVKMIVQKMKSSKPILDESISHGKLKVIGAYYSLENGNVVVVD